jgi:hypothetical protein
MPSWSIQNYTNIEPYGADGLLKDIVEVGSNNLPAFCLPEVIQKLPLGFTYCIVYILLIFFLGSAIYLNRKGFRLLLGRNGHTDDGQDSFGQQNNITFLRRMLRRRSNTEMREIPRVDGGESGYGK